MKRKTGKRTRIRWTVLLLLSICLTLGACSAKKADTEASPRDTAKYAMEALKQLDLETWNRYTDNYVSTEKNWLGIPVSREYRVFNELLQPGHQQQGYEGCHGELPDICYGGNAGWRRHRDKSHAEKSGRS